MKIRRDQSSSFLLGASSRPNIPPFWTKKRDLSPQTSHIFSLQNTPHLSLLHVPIHTLISFACLLVYCITYRRNSGHVPMQSPQEILNREQRKDWQASPQRRRHLIARQGWPSLFLRTFPPTQNILNPSNKIQCDECKRDISKCTKLLGDEHDYCISCFSNLDEYPPQYHVINKLDFPLYDNEWTAE